jgi:hypothetical protein
MSLREIVAKIERAEGYSMLGRTSLWSALITINGIQIGIPSIIFGQIRDDISMVTAIIVTIIALISIRNCILCFDKYSKLQDFLADIFREQYSASEKNSNDNEVYKKQKTEIYSRRDNEISKTKPILIAKERCAIKMSYAAFFIIVAGSIVRFIIKNS